MYSNYNTNKVSHKSVLASLYSGRDRVFCYDVATSNVNIAVSCCTCHPSAHE